MSDFSDFEQLKQRVDGQLKSDDGQLKSDDVSVSPRDLYKLASLTARWKYRGKLPVCLLCQDVSKTIGSLGHLIPHSVLKVDPQPAFDHIIGRAVALTKMGYYAFCQECEHRFNQHGENFFTDKFFKPFLGNPKASITVNTLTREGHPWLYFCLISIIWRCMAFTPENDELFDLLEILRLFILKYPKSEELSEIKLSICAPNKDIEDKLTGDPDVHRRFFYEMYHAKFGGIPSEVKKHKGNSAWLFLGPLHVFMFYLSPPDFEKFPVISDCCTLTRKQKLFTLESVNERLFPKLGYEMIIEHGTEMLSATLRLPLLKPVAINSTNEVKARSLHLLPEFVSYDRRNDKFSFSAQYDEQCALYIRFPKSTIFGIKHKKKDEKIILIAIHNAIVDGNEVAMALRYNPGGDDHLNYAQGVHVPDPDRVTADLSEPPLKELVESLIGNKQLFKDG